MKYVTSGEFIKEYKISYNTLKRWKDEGKVKTKVLGKKKILYDLDYLNDNQNEEDNRQSVIYARVSTTIQKEQLEHQIETIKNYMLSKGINCDEIYFDIASGMNSERKAFNRLLRDVANYKIKTVYISFKDRLSRFGYEYFENIFKLYNTEIVILDKNEETNQVYQKELVEDLISIIHYYSMKIYSSRRKKLKEIEKNLKDFQNS